MLIPGIHERGRSFHLRVSSLIYFSKDMKFCHTGLSRCLIRNTPRYFILCVSIVKGMISLSQFVYPLYIGELQIFFFSSSCIQPLHWRCLSTIGVPGYMLELLMYTIISSANNDILISSWWIFFFNEYALSFPISFG